MSDLDRRAVGTLRLQIDRSLCVGFGDCVEAAPGAFGLDATGVATFQSPEGVDAAAVVRACAACPVDALTAWDADGCQLAP